MKITSPLPKKKIPKPPSAKKKIPAPPKARPKKTKQKSTRRVLTPDKYLTEIELKRLRQYVKNQADLARQRGSERAIVDELVIELLVKTGLRAAELCALNIEDLPMSHGKPVIWIRSGKGKVVRVVDISEKLQERLERFVKLWRKEAKSNEPLFTNKKKKRILYRSLYEKIKRLGRQAGINNLHPHVLRHTYASLLYNKEKDLRFVQDQLGHASPVTTAIYARTNNKARRRQVEALDDED